MAVELLNSIPQTAHEIFDTADPEVQVKLKPTLNSVLQIHTEVVGALMGEGITEEEVTGFLYDPDYPVLTEGKSISVFGRDLKALAHQYEHVRKVMGATLELKRELLEMDMPERIVAYQTGTGWPLPEENARCVKIGFIHYGEGSLAEFSPRGTRDDEEAGMHIYRLTGENSEEFTFLALKGRMHGYTETGWELASQDLAFMPRLLKGIGAEFILSSFASGADPSLFEEGTIEKQDLAVIVGGTDDSRLSTTLGPGTGDQRILGPIFGGAFKNIAAMQPEANHISLLLEAVRTVNEGEKAGSAHKPKVFPTLETDTSRTPNFQDVWAHAFPHSTFEEVLRQGKLPERLMTLFSDMPLALVHGMVQFIEREGYFQSWDVGIQSPWNRRLPELPVVIFTDLVDPAEKGQSLEISDEMVRKAGKEAERMTARIITRFFELYASKYSRQTF